MILPSLPPDDNKAPVIVGITSVFFSLATISVFLRLYVRFKNHAHGWDDYFIYASWLMAVYTQVVVGFLAKYGMGRHYEYILPNLPDLIHTFIIGEIGSFIAIGLVRTSICIFVLRLIQGTHPRTRTALYCVLSLNGLLTLAAVLSIGVQCQPLNKAWNPTIEGRCFSAHPFGTVIRVVGAFGCFTDFMCVGIPFFIFKGLQMSTGTRWSLILVMSLGLFTAACSIGKIVTVTYRVDIAWDGDSVAVWTVLELFLGIIVASLPPLRPLLATAHQTMRYHWRWYFSKDQTTKSTFVREHEFAGQARRFERLHFDFDDPIKHQASKR